MTYSSPVGGARCWMALAIMVSCAAVLWPRNASALERLCDPAHEDCRAPLIDLIDRETVRIDVAFWFMEDARLSSALARARSRGVPIRVLMDTRANEDYPGNIFCLDQIQSAGIPMREKTSTGILHWKMMLFAGQRTVQFSGANYSAEAFVPEIPWKAYVDEVIYFTDKASYVNSFMTKFDDIWTSTDGYRNYANVTSIQRAYPTFTLDPELNFPPGGFRERSVALYGSETQRIDSLMYRITDRAHTDALIAAAQRGTQVRIVTEQLQYRDESRLWHSWNVDRLWAAGQQFLINGQPSIRIRLRRHDGLSHEKLTVFANQRLAVLGSSNWTSPSTDTQLEHNLFTTDATIYAWSRDHFERKWNNTGGAPESAPFAPLPPDIPSLVSPAPGAINQPLNVTLTWSAGPWAHKYDLFVGTDLSNLTKVLDDRELGPYQQSWTMPALNPGTVYYWRVVSRTMAGLWRSTMTCSFKTTGTGGGTPMSGCLAGPTPPRDPVPVPEPQDVNLTTTGTGGSTPGTTNGTGSSVPGLPPGRAPSADGTFTGQRAVPRP
jgi:phosphatidylserine/phosphatidylglycerophosphate/cardiolipin synthase-like enzyme